MQNFTCEHSCAAVLAGGLHGEASAAGCAAHISNSMPWVPAALTGSSSCVE